MITKAIKESLRKKKKLTKPQKLKILKDARELLSDPKRWTQGEWYTVQEVATDYYGQTEVVETVWKQDAYGQNEAFYLPSKSENTAMCVMGAVAAAACLLGNGNIEDNANKSHDAMDILASCSLGTVMLEALPAERQISFESIFDYWEESKFAFGSYGYDPTHAQFNAFLKKEKLTAIEWYVQEQESDALEWVYNYNDDSDRSHDEIVALLDRAIENLSKK